MIALIASFFSLCVGPLVYQTFGPLRRTDKIVSGIILVVVTGSIVFDIIPGAYQLIGLLSFLFILVGFFGPTIIEKTFQKAADTTHKLTIYLGVLGLLAHALIEGAVLQSEQNGGNGITLAIILHRLPVGLTIWWLLRPLLGEKYALITILLMGTATCAGFFLNQLIESFRNQILFAVLQSFISGSLLHVVFYKPHADGCMHTSEDHQHHNHHNKKNNQNKVNQLKSSIGNKLIRWESLGILIGVVTLIILHAYQS
ncbi:hypothetical protein [Aliikangiella sp. IMCC44359]|uniref:hypothetical protein n=1 Tax=Aliikangiella sp. IMCC44359 TaxID=3459125 RepID=UPI00403ABEF4